MNNSFLESFTLKILTPNKYVKTFNSGKNKPCLIIATDQHHNNYHTTAKYGVDNFNHLVNELVCSLLALELGINTPIPYLVKFPDESIITRMGKLEYYPKIRHTYFATKYIDDWQPFDPENNLSLELQSQALKIFYFDMMIRNWDRAYKKQESNLFRKESDLWVLDHEYAFNFTSYITVLGKSNKDFKKSNLDSRGIDKSDPRIKKHILYPRLKGLQLDYAVLDNFLDTLDDNFWKNMDKIIPKEWISNDYAKNDYKKIKDRINDIRTDQKKFAAEIRRILS